MSIVPLSAKSGNTVVLPCGLRLYCFHSRIDMTTFVIAEPTAPVQLLSLLLGTILCHRILGHVYSLSHRAIGRYGNPKRQRYPRVISDFALSGISNSGRHITGASPETYSLIYERSFQVGFVIADMAVNFSQHAPVCVPHNGSNSKVVMALNEFPRAKSMALGVAEEPAPKFLGDAMEAVADGELSPCTTTLIDEQLAVPALRHKTGYNFKSNALKVDNALGALSFGLFYWKHDALAVKLHMARFNSPYLLRPASSVPDKKEQVAERIGNRNHAKDLLEVIGLHVDFPALGSRLFHAQQGANFKMPLLYCPIPYTLHSNDSAPAVGASPCGLAVNPFRDVKRFDSRSSQIRNTRILQEALKVALIPFARTRRTMLATPQEILGDKRVNCNCVFHVVEITTIILTLSHVASILQQVWQETLQMKFYNTDVVLGKLALECYRAGGVRKWSEKHKFGHSTISRMLKGVWPIDKEVAGAVGFKEFPIWCKIDEPMPTEEEILKFVQSLGEDDEEEKDPMAGVKYED